MFSTSLDCGNTSIVLYYVLDIPLFSIALFVTCFFRDFDVTQPNVNTEVSTV